MVNVIQETLVRFDEETGSMQYHVKYNSDQQNYVAGDAFRLALLQSELGEDEVLVKSVVALPKTKKGASRDDVMKAFAPIIAWLKAAPVLAAYTTSGSTFAVIRIQKVDGEFRDWGKFRNFKFDGMEQKANKRQGMFGTQTHTFGDRVIQFVTDDKYHAPIPGVWTVRIVDTPDWLFTAIDGVFFMRESVRDELVFDALDRQDDDDRRAHLEETLLATRKYNARFVLPGQTAKGDVVACRELNTDFVIHSTNVFTFIQSTSDRGYLTLTPQEQLGTIRTNRQSIAHFWDLLFSVPTPGKNGSLGLVKDEFKRVMNRQAELFKSGQPLSHIAPGARTEDDAIRTVQVKVMKAFERFGDLNEFPYLLSAQAAQFRDMLTPDDPDQDEKKRTRLPIPAWAGTRVSINSEFVYSMVYGELLDLEPGQCHMDTELGLIVNRYDWDLVLEVLGGADQDDHVEVHARRVTKRETWMGKTFLEGDIIFFLVRSPIGLSSDGEYLYSEYFILSPDSESRRIFLEQANYTLPDIDLTPESKGGALPRCTAEMDDDLRRSGRQPTKRNLPAEYSDPASGKQFFLDTLVGLVENRLVYDTHSAIYRKHRILGIPFEFKASEDFFIDAAVQFMNPADLAFIREDNEEARGRLPDPMPFTIMDELIDFHKEEVERWMRQARMHLKDVVETQRNLHADWEFAGPTIDGMPLFLLWVEQAEAKHRARVNNRTLYSRDFDTIGDNLAAGIAQMIRSDKPEWEIITEESVRNTILDARAHELRATKASRFPGASIETMFTPMDGKLMRGKMVDMVLDALTSNDVGLF